MTDRYTLHHGNSLHILTELDDQSIDSIVTDPPYELGFMGKKWDASGIAYSVELWAECLRVLKSGGHLLAFGGTRTYHRMTVAIEDAGFEIRDSIHWLYGSGFPKSHDVSKAIDKVGGVSPERQAKVLADARRRAGLTREQVAEAVGCTPSSVRDWEEGRARAVGIPVEHITPSDEYRERLADFLGYTADERRIVGVAEDRRGDGTCYGLGHSGTVKAGGNTYAAKQWDGWGTALKPAHEPIVVARKPLDGTVAATVLEHGTGALNIDGCRVAGADTTTRHNSSSYMTGKIGEVQPTQDTYTTGSTLGRWPANIVFTHAADCDTACVDGCPIAELDAQGDGASRFFTVTEWDPDYDVPFRYVAKPGKKERNAGLDGLPVVKTGAMAGNLVPGQRLAGNGTPIETPERQNFHPTVKPVALMRWLVRLVTPTDGIVLDPFAGSGTTLAAAILEGHHPIGIELTDDYLPIIHGRCQHAITQHDNQPQQEPTLFDNHDN